MSIIKKKTILGNNVNKKIISNILFNTDVDFTGWLIEKIMINKH